MRTASLPVPGVAASPYDDGLQGIYRTDLDGEAWLQNQRGLMARDTILRRHVEQAKSQPRRRMEEVECQD